jgi:hypothetical protein
MPREEKIKVYKFDELSPEAQKRAIQDYKDKNWDFDQTDASELTKWFKERLEDEGFDSGVEVYWSLGYCQGDGVCFKGHVDAEKLFNKEGWKTYKELAPYISIKVHQDSRNCHWNSMRVEVELDLRDSEDLIPKELYEEMEDWRVEREAMERDYRDAVKKVEEARQVPIREWEQAVRRFEEQKGVLEWLPDKPERPAPLDIPLPPEPDYPEEPKKFIRAKEKAKEKEQRFITKTNELEEEVGEWVQDLSRELEKSGYEEIEYRGSEEVISDNIMANGYEYTEDGELWS